MHDSAESNYHFNNFSSVYCLLPETAKFMIPRCPAWNLSKTAWKKKKIWYTFTVALIFIGPWRSWTLHHILYCVEWTLPLQVSLCRKCRIRTRDGLSIAVRRARNSSPPLLFHFIFPVRFSPSQSSGWASGWWPMLPPLWDSSTRWAIQFKGIVAWNHKLTRKIDQQSTL